jgi:hypothetical protein
MKLAFKILVVAVSLAAGLSLLSRSYAAARQEKTRATAQEVAARGTLAGATVKPIPQNDGTYVGEVRSFAAEMIPDGWIECDGRSLTIANHQSLLSVIGTRFGVQNAGMFNLPDLRGAFVRGWNHGKIGDGGPYDPDAPTGRTIPPGGPAYGDGTDHIGTYELDQVRSHNHPLSQELGRIESWNAAYGPGPRKAVGGPGESNLYDGNYGGSETRPSNVALVFCIRDTNAAWNKP